VSASLNIAVAGLGTVGTGALKLLARHAGLIEQRCGRRIRVAAVSDLDRSRDRGVDLGEAVWYDDAVAMAGEADVEVVVELIGGSDGVAKAVCERAIAAGRHVVTANKALLAHHGLELARAAERKGVSLAYEAAVAGGIPVIKGLREGLAGNRVARIYGILNGTCNYILTAMRETGQEFAEVLAEAQKLGYAEADPSFDIDGIDTAHKLAILTSVAFGCEINFNAVYVEGIRHVSALDISFADELGYRIKLLGLARLTGRGRVRLRRQHRLRGARGRCRAGRLGRGRGPRRHRQRHATAHLRGPRHRARQDSRRPDGASPRPLLHPPHGRGQARRHRRCGRRHAGRGDLDGIHAPARARPGRDRTRGPDDP
jgi:homoserine dehydrogenase